MKQRDLIYCIDILLHINFFDRKSHIELSRRIMRIHHVDDITWAVKVASRKTSFQYLNCSFKYRRIFGRPVITGRPAGPVRSDLLRPVPVPVVKNPDRFHLCNGLNSIKIMLLHVQYLQMNLHCNFFVTLFVVGQNIQR